MRITPGTMTIGILAVLTGLVGAYGLRSFLIEEPEPAPQPPQRTVVPLAALDLPADRVLKMGDIGLVRMTAPEMEERGIPLELTMLSSDHIVGRRLREPIRQGEPFLTNRLWPEGEGPARPRIEDMLQPGYRAVTLSVPFEDAPAVEEGGVVDVLFRSTAEDIPEMTVTLVEAADVLKLSPGPIVGIGGNARERDFTATLAVTYDDARKLEVVQGRGRLSLMARSEQDLLRGPFEKLTLAEVLQLQELRPDIPFQTEIYERGRRRINQFPSDRVVAQADIEPDRPADVPFDVVPPSSAPAQPGVR